jgi:hypothetical protein
MKNPFAVRSPIRGRYVYDEAIRDMLERGFTTYQIAKELGLNSGTVFKIVQRILKERPEHP